MKIAPLTRVALQTRPRAASVRNAAHTTTASRRVGNSTSVEGHERSGGTISRYGHVRYAPLATVGLKKAACRDGPITDQVHRNRKQLFDYLVSGEEQLLCNCETECLCRLEVDD